MKRPRSSLARSTLIPLSVCIALVIAVATLIGYLSLKHTIREQAIAQLERHVQERSQREQALFVLAEDTQAVLKKSLEERIRAWGQQDPVAHFESLFARLPDGSTRIRPEGFDGTRMPGGLISAGIPIDGDLRRRFMASYDTLAQYGPAFHVRFTNTYITLPEGALTVYWPEDPTWSLKMAPTLTPARSQPPTPTPEQGRANNAGKGSSRTARQGWGDDLWSSIAPGGNPDRRTLWSGIYRDPVTKSWMVSISTPLDLDGRHVATISYDILLRELMKRTLNDHLPDAYNLIVRDDGMLIAHPELMRGDGTSPPRVLNAAELPDTSDSQGSTREQRARLKSTYERVMSRQPGQVVLENPEYGELIAVTRLKGPDWNFVTVLPESVVTHPAAQAARYVLICGGGALLLLLVIMYTTDCVLL